MEGTGFKVPQAVSSTWAKPSGIDSWPYPADKQFVRLAFHAEKTAGLTHELRVRAVFADPYLVIVRQGNPSDFTGLIESATGLEITLPVSGKKSYEIDMITQLNAAEVDWMFEFKGENVELSDFVVVKQGVI